MQIFGGVHTNNMRHLGD